MANNRYIKSEWGRDIPSFGTYNPSEGVISPHLVHTIRVRTWYPLIWYIQSEWGRDIPSFGCYEKMYRWISTKIWEFRHNGGFNSQPDDNVLKEFLDLFDFKNLVKEPTCYKNPRNPRLIHRIITNRPKMFQNTNVETRLSDFHMMTVTVLKTSYKKGKPNNYHTQRL